MRNLWKACLSIAGIVLLYKLKTLFQVDGLILADPVSGAIAGGLALGKGLFGTASSQQGTQRAFTQFRPEDLAAIQQAAQGTTAGTQSLLDAINAASQAYSTQFVKPPTSFSFSQTPDAMTRAIAAQATQGLAQQGAAQRADLAQKFRGPVGQILGRQAEMQTRLQQNPLLFQSFRDQQSREAFQNQQNLANIEAANRALAQQQQGLVGLAGTGVSAQGNLLAQRLGLGQALGEQIQTQAQRGRSGGMLK